MNDASPKLEPFALDLVSPSSPDLFLDPHALSDRFARCSGDVRRVSISLLYIEDVHGDLSQLVVHGIHPIVASLVEILY